MIKEQRSCGSVDRGYTVAFRRWFNRSAVLDRGGSPLLCFHGSSEAPLPHPMMHFGTLAAAHDRLRTQAGDHDFEPPEVYLERLQHPDYRSHLASLTTSAQSAHGPVPTYHVYGTGAAIFPAYLAIKNPLRLAEDPYMVDLRIGLPDDLCHDLAVALRAAGYDLPHILSVVRRADRDAVAASLLADRGYDGIAYPNYWEDHGSISWIVLRPEQIWLALPTMVDHPQFET